MQITYDNSTGWQIDHDGLIICELKLEDAIQSFGEGMFQRGKLFTSIDNDFK